MTAAPTQDTRFRVTEEQARQLASEFGTPLYVLSESGFEKRIERFQSSLKKLWPNGEVSFATKANSTYALLAIAANQGCRLDGASEGEVRAALAAGADPRRVYLHGNNKSRAEIELAVTLGLGQIVADNFRELEAIADVFAKSPSGYRPGIAIRLAPGVDPQTHEKISTGQADTKFGFNIGDGSAERATVRALELGLHVIGYHCHVGSQLLDADAQRGGAELIAEFAARMKAQHGVETTWLNVGGGLGIQYLDSDEVMPIEQYVGEIVAGVQAGLAGSGLDPLLILEPGRALVGEEGLTLYEVGVIKDVPLKDGSTRTYVCVDGGLADNPRPTMYGARYTVRRAARGSETRTANPGERLYTVSGRHCETDKLFADVSLPADLAEGDLLQVLCTGAYSSSMASNYNRYPRPATVLVRKDGSFALVQKRESFEEMGAREVIPSDLGAKR
ncbi:MAG: diaminopimelate decarboxylase [Armatimonadetes bacterium]|nr:diaminopimelate decarboxylase [Armatimonadota bacterium]